MTKERLIQSIKANIWRGKKRTDFMKAVFAGYGDNVSYFPKIMPLYPELIKFGNNIVVASGVHFITHDAIHKILNNIPSQIRGRDRFKERVGCIEIGDNVFIGSNTTIMYNTIIGSNVIIGSGTMVLSDLESNSVYVGMPARKIGTFDDFIKKRIETEADFEIEKSQVLTDEEIQRYWREFYQMKQNITKSLC